MSSHQDTSRFLRLALRGNAAFSTLSALAFFAASGPIASFLGFINAKSIFVLGIQLAVFALLLVLLSTRPVIAAWKAWTFIALDLLWVVGSFRLILTPPAEMSTGGAWAVGIVADIVGLFALLQFIGLRRQQKAQLQSPA